ncbi:MAG: cobyric acid synthase CobQ [Desulfococcus sp.]|nr:MAG: cobyric acid synthase CobQ [Desulfococcus sp.]
MPLPHPDTRPPAPALACFGTGSDVGKSVLAAALCRIIRRQGFRPAPYKAQNMSNNSGITPEGKEMGRAQITQAEACGIPPHVDMNPVLLKPATDIGAQVVLMGEAGAHVAASDYHQKKNLYWKTAAGALDRLRAAYDAVIIEGAGSCAEVNLMAHDIVNFRVAEYADAPVLLIADIHRGGVFAQIVGTLECLPPARRDRVAGFLINRFRGDISLFSDGVKWIEQKTGKPVFGVIPWFSDFHIASEDSVVLEQGTADHLPPPGASDEKPVVAVIRLPHIANFTDLDPLHGVEGLTVHLLSAPRDLSPYAAVILPGSKNTRHDLDWLMESGWGSRLRRYAAPDITGGHVLGVCGGYQMMGRLVHDPDGLEGPPGTTEGLGLLPVETRLRAPKTTTRTVFDWEGIAGEGYEIHMGQTDQNGGTPLLAVHTRNGKTPRSGNAGPDAADGCRDASGRILGTYIHGFFDTPPILYHWLRQIGLGHLHADPAGGLPARQRALDQLADHMERHADTAALLSLLDMGRNGSTAAPDRSHLP